jgi:glycosyltransferase involved in cell wall biosynthesis
MPKFSIIIPVFNNAELTKKCVQTIRENSTDYEIIIVDNGSSPAYEGFGKIIRNEKNEGFPISVNQGLKQAQGEILVILNNDTLVTPHWLEYFEEHLKTYDIVGPVSNNVSGLQQIPTDGYAGLDQLYEFSAKTNRQNDGNILAWHRLVFFCVAFTRQVYNTVGILDERFTPGNFEDDDYCLRAIEKGFKLGIAFDIFIHHKASATHQILNLDKKKLLEINQEKFNKKWPQARYQELQKIGQGERQQSILNQNSNLTLVMIVKNEAKGLERAILSTRGLVRDIIIAIDNQTTDETEIIAKKYATEIKHFDFKDDFSAARNFAQENVKTDWILFLDGHEYIKQAPELTSLLKSDSDGLLCTIEMETGAQFKNPRIFRKEVKFSGPIHEQQQCKKLQPAYNIIIKHDRLASQSKESVEEREQQRNRQMPEIMGKLLKANKKNTRASFHLYLYYAGRQKLSEAKQTKKLFLKYSKNKGDRWFVFFNTALLYLTHKKYYRAYLATGQAERETPGRWEISKLRGLIFFDQKNYKRALNFLIESFKENTGEVAFKPWQRDLDKTWNLIGECFFNLGQYYQASEAFKRGAQLTEQAGFKDLLARRAELMREMAIAAAPRK